MRLTRTSHRYDVVCACIAAALAAFLSSAVPAGAAGAPVAKPTCRPIFYPRVGAAAGSVVRPHGPGLILMGGSTDVDAAFRWMHRTIAGTASGGVGDVVVLRASGDNDYDAYIYGLARFNSVRTILLPPCSTPADIAKAASVVDRAQGVFFGGGDQANYVIWKKTPLAPAVQRLYDRGGVVGGTSAGLAILGQYAFDAVAGDRTHDVHTPDAVADPYEPAISFTEDLFDFPPLRGTITDTHFAARDRLGRLAAFMAVLVAGHSVPGDRIKGIGVQERSALVVDSTGWATLLLQGSGGRALLLQGGKARQAVKGKPLVTSPIAAVLLDRSGQRFDLKHWCGDGKRYEIVVDGTHTPMYVPADPYFAPRTSTPAACE
jgi:cyanophycinase-like exopeptidase